MDITDVKVSSEQQPASFWSPPIELRLITLNPRFTTKANPPLMHRHPFYELSVLLKGQCNLLLGRRTIKLQAGQAALLSPGQRHAERVPGKDCSIAWVGFQTFFPAPAWCNRVINLGTDFDDVLQTIQMLDQEQWHRKRFGSQRAGLLLQTLTLLLSRSALDDLPEQEESTSTLKSPQVACVESAALYFRQNLEDCMSIAQVAAYYSYCPSHFSRLFLKHHGMLPTAYLLHARLEHAAHLLLTSNQSVKEIASRSGFADSAHFCKAFRAHYRLTPISYRKSGASCVLPE